MSGPTSKWTAPESAVISFPKCTGTPSLLISHVHALPLSPPLPSMWRLKLFKMNVFYPLTLFLCAVEVQKFIFYFIFLYMPTHSSILSRASPLLLRLKVNVSLNHTSHCQVIIITAPFLVVPFPIARASCSTNAPLRLPGSFLPSSGNNSHESQHDTALG